MLPLCSVVDDQLAWLGCIYEPKPGFHHMCVEKKCLTNSPVGVSTTAAFCCNPRMPCLMRVASPGIKCNKFDVTSMGEGLVQDTTLM